MATSLPLSPALHDGLGWRLWELGGRAIASSLAAALYEPYDEARRSWSAEGSAVGAELGHRLDGGVAGSCRRPGALRRYGPGAS